MRTETKHFYSIVSAKAVENGMAAEEHAESIYNISVTNEFIDAEYKGLPLEVKSCQSWVVDENTTTGRRRGRFRIPYNQHEYLMKTNGLYAFILQDEHRRLISSRVVSASHIDNLINNNVVTSLAWTNIFHELVEVV